MTQVMYTETRNLLNKRAVVTGGCSGMGLEAVLGGGGGTIGLPLKVSYQGSRRVTIRHL